MLALKNSNALLTLELCGGGTQLALPKDVQRNPIRGDIEHVDLVMVRAGERVTVEVPRARRRASRPVTASPRSS